MHALHFTFGVGAFLAPVISRPFLLNEADMEHTEAEIGNITENSTNLELEVRNTIESSTWTIKDLYPMVGSYPILISLLFLFYFVKDSRKASEQSKETDESNGKKENVEKLKFKIVTVGLVAIFFFLYVGMEVAFGTFVSVFAVESKLKFTRPQGSDLTAVFWGSFAATRGLAIFIAIIAKPGLIMWSSFFTCIIGSVTLSVWAQSSATALYLGTALMGVGMASIFATGFLWVEQRMTVTSRVGSLLIIASSAGADVFPVLVGQLVETWPMAFIHLTTGIVFGCVLMFLVITMVSQQVQAKNVAGNATVELD